MFEVYWNKKKAKPMTFRQPLPDNSDWAKNKCHIFIAADVLPYAVIWNTSFQHTLTEWSPVRKFPLVTPTGIANKLYQSKNKPLFSL